jgi:hypothetical protein
MTRQAAMLDAAMTMALWDVDPNQSRRTVILVHVAAKLNVKVNAKAIEAEIVRLLLAEASRWE